MKTILTTMTNAEKTGRQNAPKVSVDLYKIEDTGKYAIKITIGVMYYETAQYGNPIDAFDEASGYLDQLIEYINQEIHLPF